MPQHQDFQRTIGLSTATALVITTIIGSGIFMRPAEMAALLGSPYLIFSVWVIAGLFTMLSVMVLAEVAAMIPETGGNYAFMRHMYGNFWAYLFGWASFAVVNCAGSAGIAFITSQYLEYFFKNLAVMNPILAKTYASIGNSKAIPQPKTKLVRLSI